MCVIARSFVGVVMCVFVKHSDVCICECTEVCICKSGVVCGGGVLVCVYVGVMLCVYVMIVMCVYVGPNNVCNRWVYQCVYVCMCV